MRGGMEAVYDDVPGRLWASDTIQRQCNLPVAPMFLRSGPQSSKRPRYLASRARSSVDSATSKLAANYLAPVYGWFTESFDTLDLKEAKALLEELAA